MSNGEKTWVWTAPINLPTVGTSGMIPMAIPKAAKFMAVLNGSGAVLAVSNGINYQHPQDAILVQPYIYIGFPIDETQQQTIHWSSAGVLSPTNNQAVVMYSNDPIILSGGPMTAGGVASNVTLIGTPTVNINSMPNLNIASLPHVLIDDGSLATMGLMADAPNITPATSGSLISWTKGLLKQLQGGGAGALPISNTNLDTTISSLVTAVNAVTTAVNAVTTAVSKDVIAAITPTIYNVTCTAANTEYTQALPANTKRYTIMNRGNAPGTVWKMYFSPAAANTMDFPGNMGYSESNLILTAQTLYFKSTNAGDVIQILAWV